MPVAIALWAEKPYELFDKLDSDSNTPQVVSVQTNDEWGTDADAQERMEAFMELAGPSDWDPTVPFTPSYGAAPPARTPDRSAI